MLRDRRYLFPLITLALLLCISCDPVPNTKDKVPASQKRSQNSYDQISLDVKIGQMVMAGFQGFDIDDSHPIVRDIKERHLGGVILFDYDVVKKQPGRNIKDPQQLKTLTGKLKGYAEIPLLVAIDYEGGYVNRLKERNGFPPTLSHRQLTDLNDTYRTISHSALMSNTLRELGFNLNLAPVADLLVNADNPVIAKQERAFSSDAGVTASQVLAFIEGSHINGILTSLKHFPGHGSSMGDSHRGMVDITNTWSEKELEPFERAINSGKVDTIMTAHVFHKGFDEKYPATLSKPIITGLLRGKLGYEGVVISDDMGMGAITANYDIDTALSRAIEAGVDIILISNNAGSRGSDISGSIIGTIKRLIREGKVSTESIDNSFERIMKLKSKML